MKNAILIPQEHVTAIATDARGAQENFKEWLKGVRGTAKILVIPKCNETMMALHMLQGLAQAHHKVVTHTSVTVMEFELNEELQPLVDILARLETERAVAQLKDQVGEMIRLENEQKALIKLIGEDRLPAYLEPYMKANIPLGPTQLERRQHISVAALKRLLEKV